MRNTDSWVRLSHRKTALSGVRVRAGAGVKGSGGASAAAAPPPLRCALAGLRVHDHLPEVSAAEVGGTRQHPHARLRRRRCAVGWAGLRGVRGGEAGRRALRVRTVLPHRPGHFQELDATPTSVEQLRSAAGQMDPPLPGPGAPPRAAPARPPAQGRSGRPRLDASDPARPRPPDPPPKPPTAPARAPGLHVVFDGGALGVGNNPAPLDLAGPSTLILQYVYHIYHIKPLSRIFGSSKNVI